MDDARNAPFVKCTVDVKRAFVRARPRVTKVAAMRDRLCSGVLYDTLCLI